MEITKTEIVLPDPQGQNLNKVAFLLNNVLTEDECQQLIVLTQNNGYQPASLKNGTNVRILDSNIRNNSRCVINDEDIANSLWTKIKDHIPTSFKGNRLVNIHPKLRFLKYETGEYFKPHYDGCTETADGKFSLLTLQIYLNEGFQGGSTRFLLDPRDPIINSEPAFVDIIPKTGSILVFEHEIYHEGCTLEGGVKYTIRTDVMYSSPGIKVKS